MRVDCPDCGASYEVPEAMLSPGRAVRCARCGRGWAPIARRGAPAAGPPRAAPDAAASDGTGLDGPHVPDRAPNAADAAGPRMPGPGAPPVVPASLEAEAAPPPAPQPSPHSPGTVSPPLTAPDPPGADAGGPGRGLLAAWIGSLALLAAGAAAAVTWHAGIAAAWPPAIRLFRALGLSS